MEINRENPDPLRGITVEDYLCFQKLDGRRKSTSESMPAYIEEFNKLHRDAEIRRVSDHVYSFKLLNGSGLPQSQQEEILKSCKDLTVDEISSKLLDISRQSDEGPCSSAITVQAKTGLPSFDLKIEEKMSFPLGTPVPPPAVNTSCFDPNFEPRYDVTTVSNEHQFSHEGKSISEGSYYGVAKQMSYEPYPDSADTNSAVEENDFKFGGTSSFPEGAHESGRTVTTRYGQGFAPLSSSTSEKQIIREGNFVFQRQLDSIESSKQGKSDDSEQQLVYRGNSASRSSPKEIPCRNIVPGGHGINKSVPERQFVFGEQSTFGSLPNQLNIKSGVESIRFRAGDRTDFKTRPSSSTFGAICQQIQPSFDSLASTSCESAISVAGNWRDGKEHSVESTDTFTTIFNQAKPGLFNFPPKPEKKSLSFLGVSATAPSASTYVTPKLDFATLSKPKPGLFNFPPKPEEKSLSFLGVPSTAPSANTYVTPKLDFATMSKGHEFSFRGKSICESFTKSTAEQMQHEDTFPSIADTKNGVEGRTKTELFSSTTNPNERSGTSPPISTQGVNAVNSDLFQGSENRSKAKQYAFGTKSAFGSSPIEMPYRTTTSAAITNSCAESGDRIDSKTKPSSIFGGRLPENQQSFESLALTSSKSLISDSGNWGVNKDQSLQQRPEVTHRMFQTLTLGDGGKCGQDLTSHQNSERNEEVIFKDHCKLYRYDGKDWEKKASGEIKILRSHDRNYYRVVMWNKDKVCLNHVINTTTIPELHQNTETCMYLVNDYSDASDGCTPTPMKIAISFETRELCKAYMKKIVEIKASCSI